MKEKPDHNHIFNDDTTDAITGDDNDPMTDRDYYGLPTSTQKSAHKGPKWYEMIEYTPEFLDKLPKLRYVRGAKKRLTVQMYEQIYDVCQQIFECNKHFFRFRAQVDMIAHYIGAKMLEEIYIKRPGLEKDPLSLLLERREQAYKTWDKMKLVKGVFSDLMEKYVAGFINNAEICAEIDEYIATFSDKNDREKMQKIIDTMMMDGETYKAKERNRKNSENRKKAESQGLREVK